MLSRFLEMAVMVMIISDPGVDSIVVSGCVVIFVEFDKYTESEANPKNDLVTKHTGLSPLVTCVD